MIDRQENVERLERVALYEQERLRARVIAAEEKFERQQSHKRELIERIHNAEARADAGLRQGLDTGVRVNASLGRAPRFATYDDNSCWADTLFALWWVAKAIAMEGGAVLEALCREAVMLALREDLHVAAVGARHFEAALQAIHRSAAP